MMQSSNYPDFVPQNWAAIICLWEEAQQLGIAIIAIDNCRRLRLKSWMVTMRQTAHTVWRHLGVGEAMKLWSFVQNKLTSHWMLGYTIFGPTSGLRKIKVVGVNGSFARGWNFPLLVFHVLPCELMKLRLLLRCFLSNWLVGSNLQRYYWIHAPLIQSRLPHPHFSLVQSQFCSSQTVNFSYDFISISSILTLIYNKIPYFCWSNPFKLLWFSEAMIQYDSPFIAINKP